MKQGENWYITPGSGTTTQLAGGPGTLSSSPSTSYFGDIQATRPLGERNILTVGGSYRYDWEGTTEWNLSSWRDEYTKKSIQDHSGGRDMNYALFAQDEIHIIKPLTAYLGAREDWWRVFDGFANTIGAPGYPQQFSSNNVNHFSPKGAASLYALRGRRHRAPGLSRRGLQSRPAFITSSGRGGPSLVLLTTPTPSSSRRRATSWEIGGEQKVWNGGVFKATYFENYINDMIYQYNVNPTTVQLHQRGQGEHQGIRARPGTEVRQLAPPLRQLHA